jgi:hypothetical protein
VATQGKRIGRQQIEIYWDERGAGKTIKEASFKAGFGESSALKFERMRKQRLPTDEKGRIKNQPDPLVPSELGPKAKRALKDFGYFQRRYFGRVPYHWQIEAANLVVELLESPHKEYLVVNCPPGVGKALSVDTMLATPTGWTTIGLVQPGDVIFDDQGQPTTVTYKSEVFYGHDCYEVATDDGASVIADADHLWPVQFDGYKSVRNTERLANRLSKRPQLAVAEPLAIRGTHLVLDPYVLGAWLGDGDSGGGRMSCHPDDAKFIRGYFEDAGFVTTDHKAPINFGVLGLGKKLRRIGVQRNKHIPERYMRASRAQRLRLLQGLVDTDGHVDSRGIVEFTSTNWHLAKGVQFLVRSLGAKASLNEGRATIDGRDCGPKWRVSFLLADSARLPRKAILTRNGVRTPNRYLTVTQVDSVPTQCIQVDSPSSLFLAGDGLMVTHNTTLFTHDIPAWITARNRAIRGMMGSSTTDLAARYTNRLRRTLARTLPERGADDDIKLGRAFDAECTMADDFGRFQSIGDQWTADSFIVQQPFEMGAISEKEPTWSAYGQDAAYIGGRFNFVVWDDLVDPKKQRTIEAKEALQNYWDDVSEPRLEPGGLLILQGQRFASDDLYRYCLDKQVGEDIDWDTGEILDSKPKYHHILYKAHYEEKCQGPETHGRNAPAYPDGCLLSPWRLPWREISGLMTNRQDRFEVVYQQQDSDPASVLVPKAWIFGHDSHPGCVDEDRDRLELPKRQDGTMALTGDLISVITADPSPTKFWAIEWWIYQPSTEFRWLMDLEKRPMEADEFLDFNYAAQSFTGVLEEWYQTSTALGQPVTHVIVEENAAQRFLLQYDHVRRWMALRGVEILGHSTHRNKSDPEYGVETIRQHYKFGRVRLPYKRDSQGWVASTKLIDEVTHYPHGRTDDCTMAHWFLEWNLPRIYSPSEAEGKAWRPSWASSVPSLKRNPGVESGAMAMMQKAAGL